MNRTKVYAFCALALLAAFVAYLALRERQPPLLPADAEHGPSIHLDECMLCHGPEGVAPHSVNHPLGDDCRRCHGRP